MLSNLENVAFISFFLFHGGFSSQKVQYVVKFCEFCVTIIKVKASVWFGGRFVKRQFCPTKSKRSSNI